MPNTRCYVLNAGGTLGMVGKPLRPAKSAAELFDGLKLHGNVILGTMEDFPGRDDSTNINHANRINMCEMIARAYDAHDFFVLLHGTDSIAETAAVMNMVFKRSLQKPLLVVGAQMTRDEPGTDAVMQLENTVRIGHAFARRCITGVYSVCVSDVLDGSRLLKIKESDAGYLITPGRHPVAKAWPNITFMDGLRYREPVLSVQGLRLDKGFERRVFSTLEARADTDPDALRMLVDSGKYKGVILQCKGAGQLSDRPWADENGDTTCSWVEAVAYATSQGVYCAILSPFQDGRVILTRYELGQKLKDAGAISLESLTPDMGDVKFRWALAQRPNDPVRIQEFLSTNIVGELLPGIEDEE